VKNKNISERSRNKDNRNSNASEDISMSKELSSLSRRRMSFMTNISFFGSQKENY